MFRFENSNFLYFLAILPVLIGLYYLAGMFRKRALGRLGDAKLIKRMMPLVSPLRSSMRLVLLMLGMIFLILGLTNPQWGTRKEKINSQGINFFIAMDISKSMLAEDVAPSRLLRARKFAHDLIEEVKGDKVGVIFFACNAYVQVPLTVDYTFAEMSLKYASPDLSQSQGTSLAGAINLAASSFTEDDKNHRALVVITDGEDHEGGGSAAAAAAKENGLIVYTIGVGKTTGAQIPTVVRGRRDIVRDENGMPVSTALNESLLDEIANSGGGAYFNLNAGTESVTSALKKHIERIEKQSFEQRIFTEYESYFQWFIGIALIFFIVEFLVPKSKGPWFRKLD